MRSPACRTILLISWRRKSGSSSFWLPTNPSAKSPQSSTLTSPSSPSLLPTPASPPACPPSHRPPSRWCPPSRPASRPSPLPPTPSSPAAAAAAALPCPLPPSQTARWRWRTWNPLFWRSPWIWCQRRSWRRRALCLRSTCPAPSTQLRTGSPFMPQPVTMTLSPCAPLWWPARRPAPPSRPLSSLPSPRRNPSPLVASPTGEEATATTSPPIPSVPPPCWPFKDSSKKHSTSYKKKHILLKYETHVQITGLWNELVPGKQSIYIIICLYLYLLITPM